MAAAATYGLSKRYRGTVALDDVSVELAENRIHGLLGRNGAGKTTLMQLLTAQTLPSTGRVELFGEQPYENAGVLARTCFVRESLKYPDQYRVRHALRAAAAVFPGWDQALADDLVGEFELPLRRPCKKLSRGQLSAVGVVIGLASRAPLTFFDEPYLGLDAAARRLFYDRLLADFAEHPRTILLSTHLIDEVSDLVEHVVVLDRGRVLIDADTDDLRGRAVTVSGPAEVVERFVAGHAELHRESLGAFLRVTVRDASPAAAEGAGLACEPVSLQQLVVSSTQRRPAADHQEVLS